MTKTKKYIILIGSIDLLLIIMHLFGYYFLFLKPTGYLIPIAVNIVALAIIGFRHPRFSNLLVVAGVWLGFVIMLIYAFFIWIEETSYERIDSPHNQQALVVEYRKFTLGETTYYYDFYKTKYGLIGKELSDQSIQIMIQGRENPEGSNPEEILGMDNSEWVTKRIVRFISFEGPKEVHLDSDSNADSTQTEVISTSPNYQFIDKKKIEQFIEKAEQKTNGDEISINGNTLVTRYDDLSGQYWIEVQNPGDQAPIPRQQCTRIVRNEERQYYMLEECTHKWEYELYPITSK